MEQTTGGTAVLAPAPETSRAEYRIGLRPGSGKRTIVALVSGSAALLIVAMVTILVTVMSFWRSSEPVPAEPAVKSYTGTLAESVWIAPVLEATEGSCSGGGTSGRFAGGGCFTLGDGGMVVSVVERVNTALQDGKWYVQLRLSSVDTVALRALTSALTTQNKRIALVLDGTVLTTLPVPQPITDGVVRISGDFAKKDADSIFAELTER